MLFLRVSIAVACLLTACVPLAAAQPPRLSFEHLTVDDGLPENSVRAMVQDATGFLWLGTHSGLARYDGRQIIDPWHSSADSSSVPRFMVLSLAQDRAGRIWVGTAQHGLWLLDPQRETLRAHPCANSGPREGTESSSDLLAICASADGGMWFGWSSGRLCHHDHTLRCSTRQVDEALVDSGLNALLEDSQGRLWVGTTDAGLLLREGDGSALRRFRHDDKDPHSLAADLVNAIYEGPDGQIWVSTLHGLSAYHARERNFRNFRPDTDVAGEWAEYLLQMTSADGGGLWIGSALGLYHFDPLSGQFELHAHDPEDPSSPVKGPVLSVLRDRSGIVWGGSWHAGLNKLDPKRAKFRVEAHDAARAGTLDENEVLAILEDRAGTLWVGTGTASTGISVGGLNRRRRGETVFEQLPLPGDGERRASSVRGLCADEQNRVWISTDVGLFVYEPQLERVRRPRWQLPADSPLLRQQMRGMCVDRSGNLWVCGSGTGLFRIDLARGTVQAYEHDPADPHSLSESRVNFAFCDREGRVWVGADTRGLNLYRPDSDDFLRYYDLERGLVSPTDMLQDRTGRLWLASWEGLLQFDPQQVVVRAIRREHGLPHDLVASLVEDASGRLWLSTGRGIVRLQLEDGAMRVFDRRDGLPSNGECFARGTAIDGRLFFGGHKGLISFLPSEIHDSDFRPEVVLTELRIGDEPQRPGSRSLEFAMPYARSLELAHDQNDLGFRFAALDLVHPDRILFRYRLVGFEQQWRDAQHRNSATYTNLRPGRYQFQVEASNSDGVWTGAQSELALTVLPPWWQTNWARTLYVLLALGIAAAIYTQLVQRERMQAALRIERAQAQQLQELDQFKSRFFANISHEFRTPLTLLQVPLQRLRDDPTGGDRVLFSMMSRNADRLRELIDQLLDLARLEAGRLPLRWQHGDWLGFLRALIASFQSMAATRGVELAYELPPAAPIAWHDPDVLEKVVGNLLSNAFRFTPDQGEVRIRARVEDRDGSAPVPVAGQRDTGSGVRSAAASWLVLEIFNSGSYIPPADRTRIFDRFEQTGADRAGHSGIGLALVKELVDWMHGSVSVQSSEGVGTSFTLALPLYHEAPVLGLEPSEPLREDEALAPSQAASERGEPGGEETPLILVVEDNSDLRNYLRHELSGDYRVIEATDGESGLALAFEELPDLVLSDVMMPGIDGLELTRRIKEDERTSHVPVILLTARVEIESRREGLQTGADDYLAKPFDAKELSIRVANLIEQRRKLAERFAQRVVQLTPESMPVVSADERFLARAYKVIEEHLDDAALDVETLCREIGLSRAQLHRKLKALTGQSTREFLRTHRLHRAAKLLEGGFGNVTEVAFAVGFSSSSYFAQCFREQFGVSPTEYVAKGRAKAEGSA